LAKIAVELKHAIEQRAATGAAGQASARVLAQGPGWSVADVLCTAGPQDRPFDERHNAVCVAWIAAGTFQYRSGAGRELMTPGSLLLGNAGQSFECGHEHGVGDRCLSFRYAPEYFGRLAADAGIRSSKPVFGALRLPPLRDLSPVLARAHAALSAAGAAAWEELGIDLAVQTLQLTHGLSRKSTSDAPSTLARVTRAVRGIEEHPADALSVDGLAREVRLSPYHFLRTFQCLTGVTPHQYILRTRLRHAAQRLATEPTQILDVALECGFGDASNFVRAFRTEFGVNPRAWRRAQGCT